MSKAQLSKAMAAMAMPSAYKILPSNASKCTKYSIANFRKCFCLFVTGKTIWLKIMRKPLSMDFIR